MSSVDLTKYLTYIRKQGGSGCWGYSMLAMWDVLNELHSPNSPNLSMNQWLRHFRYRVSHDNLVKNQGMAQMPDGRWYDGTMEKPEFGLLQVIGLSTEGCEPHSTHERDVGSLTREGLNEAGNYRLKGKPVDIKVSAKSFKKQLDKWRPIRLDIGSHVVAILGYDDAKSSFTFVDSSGDRAHKDGFGTFSYTEIDANKTWMGNTGNAYTIKIVPPKPVPVAEIWIEHAHSRSNLNIWVSMSDSPRPKTKLWPAWEDPDDDSRNLHYKVPLPREMMWPPTNSSRVALDVFDSDAIHRGAGGGKIHVFRAMFGNHIVNSTEVLNNNPISFAAGEHRRFFVP